VSAGRLDAPAAAAAAAAMDRFSFAQAREAYIMAGQCAFDRGNDVTPDDLIRAAQQMKREGRRLATPVDGRAVGSRRMRTRRRKSVSVLSTVAEHQ